MKNRVKREIIQIDKDYQNKERENEKKKKRREYNAIEVCIKLLMYHIKETDIE